MLNILIPMAGEGSRFKKNGFKNIKPLIKVNKKTFIEWSIESVDFSNIRTRFIFVILEEHRELLEDHLKKIKPDCVILSVPELTRGAAETSLVAKELINNDSPLIITNSDQIFEWNLDKYIDYVLNNDFDGNVITVNENTEKFSYIKLDENGYGIKLAEKEVISNEALVGIHYWKKGSYFVESTEELIRRNIRANNEFYVSLTYNILIERGLKITSYRLSEEEKYLSVGTPEQLYDYINYKNLNIEKFSMRDMFRGWFIGDFEPSVYKTKDFEVGYLKHLKGEKWDVHYHEKSKEINYLIRGKMIINDKHIKEGDIFVIDKYVMAKPEFLEDCELIVVKVPSVPGDKIIL